MSCCSGSESLGWTIFKARRICMATVARDFRRTSVKEGCSYVPQCASEIEKRMRAQHEKKCKEQDESLRKEVAEKNEKEFEEQQKKKKLEEEETKSEEEDVKSTEEPESKKQKLEKGKLKSEEIQEQLDEVPKKLDKLTEAKSEMVWLLKQVIKADTKRKMEVMKKRKMGGMKN